MSDDELVLCDTIGIVAIDRILAGLVDLCVERDKPAILAGLTLPYSRGPVEGHIHRLKLIKREAYGRAGLSYLQHRFLSAA